MSNGPGTSPRATTTSAAMRRRWQEYLSYPEEAFHVSTDGCY
ncbi:hypothetical protein ACNI65_11380 [Roseateles sp. So40a]